MDVPYFSNPEPEDSQENFFGALKHPKWAYLTPLHLMPNGKYNHLTATSGIIDVCLLAVTGMIDDMFYN